MATFAERCESFRTEFFQYVEQAQHVVITAHISPDDDSIASVLSTYTILNTKYPEKDIRIVYTGEVVSRYNIFHNFEKIEWVDDIANHVDGTDMLIVLDVNNKKRTSKFPEKLENIPTRIAIDHHASAPDAFMLAFIEPDRVANAELIYHALGAEPILTKELAELFLLGILGDTGNLVYISPAQTDVFLLVKRLVEMGNIRIDSFLSRFKTIPKKITPLLQELVKNTTYINIGNWPAVQYSFLSRSLVETGQFSDEDLSSASHIYMSQYLPRIEGQPWGFVITPRNDGTSRMSSRSVAGSVNVRVFHEQLGIGGGHDRAAGGFFPEREPTDCVTRVLDWMKEHDPVLG